jgi:hypothetical protein
VGADDLLPLLAAAAAARVPGLDGAPRAGLVAHLPVLDPHGAHPAAAALGRAGVQHAVAHRVHHGSNHQYLDKNYGGILIVWDRLFGTWEPEEERVRYGLTKQLATFNPVRVAFHEYIELARDVRAARGWRTKVAVAFRGPGWTP